MFQCFNFNHIVLTHKKALTVHLYLLWVVETACIGISQALFAISYNPYIYWNYHDLPDKNNLAEMLLGMHALTLYHYCTIYRHNPDIAAK
jgi:hypothetical protein